jgi:DNA-binding Lrp family transcriptional regulator
MIEQLASDGRLAELPTTDGAVARERRAAPEATFTELATRLGLSRARVQRAFQRIEAAASATLPTADL